MEGTLVINFYTSAGRGIQNMWIDSENGGQGMRYEAANPEEAGKALQKYLEMQNKQSHNK